MATLSSTDKSKLTAKQQQQVQAYKDQWEAAKAKGDTAGMEAAHQGAESIRASAGYSGGSSGTGYNVLSANQGGKTASQIQSELEAYQNQYYDENRGWTNGYSVSMNTRSKANLIRQQMDANSKAWHTAGADQDYLHEQNKELAKLLYQYTGQSEKNTAFNENTGRWETWNGNVGYGYNLQHTQPNIANSWKNYYGYTDEEMENWAKDTSHYSNFVDVHAPARNSIDESSGFTGQYAQFVNGPYGQIFGIGTQGYGGGKTETYEDVIGDGFNDQKDYAASILPQYDALGNIIKTAPALKNNNTMTAYTNQFAPRVENGLILPNTGGEQAKTAAKTATRTGGQVSENAAEMPVVPDNAPVIENLSGANGYGGYLGQLYSSALEAQLKALQNGYLQNVSDLDAGQAQVDATYGEQKRQIAGQSEQNAAAWREVANANGLASGAVGQAALAQKNQLQSDLTKLNGAQAAAKEEFQRQRLLLGQQYQLAIEQAIAENRSDLAKQLYEEAVRAEEVLLQQEQFYANLMLQYFKAIKSGS